MSIASHRRKLARLAEDDEAECEATLAELIQGSAETQARNRSIETLVAFARELAGTSRAPPAEQLPARARPRASATLPPELRFTREDAWNPKPLPAAEPDEQRQHKELMRELRWKLKNFCFGSIEAGKILDKYPELRVAAGYVEPYEPGSPEDIQLKRCEPWRQ